MSSENNSEILKDIAMIIECLSSDSDSSDDEILVELVNICEDIENSTEEKRKRKWVKSWRKERHAQGAFKFLTKELLLSDKESFLNYIRMDQTTFNILLQLIEKDIVKKDTQMRDSISPAEKLVATLRFLATGETFKSLNYQTRISQPYFSKAIPEVCEAIWKNLKSSYLKFPDSTTEWERIADEFAIRWQFPNCLGALDGKHIAFRSLRKDGSYYHNYKGSNSIILLALADANCKLIYVDIGCNGRTNDAGVLLQSSLQPIINDGDRIFPKSKIVGNGRELPYVIVGDDAFPLQRHIMKPYPFRSQCKTKRIFNVRLSRARHVVEHTFGILSNRFKVLQSTMNQRVEHVESITKACCVLHNFLLKHGSNNINIPLQQPEMASTSTTATDSNVFNPRKGAVEAIRQNFAEYFCNEGAVDWQNKQI